MNFEQLLEESVKTHGHLCPGQVLGVKMSMLGLREIGIKRYTLTTPKGFIKICIMRRITVLLLIALVFLSVSPFVTNAAPSCDENCHACFFMPDLSFGTTIAAVDKYFYQQCQLTLSSGFSDISNFTSKSSLIIRQIEHPPEVNLSLTTVSKYDLFQNSLV